MYLFVLSSVIADSHPGKPARLGGSVGVHCLNLTPLDFYLWGTLKDVVYRKKPATLGDLRAEIRAACAAISINTLTEVAQSTARRCSRCLAAKGKHFEHLH